MPKTIHHLSERSKLRGVFSIFSVLAIAAAAGCVSVPEKKADSSAPNAAQTSPNPVVSTPQTKRVPTAEGTWLKDLTSGCKVWTAIKNANLSVRWYGPCEDGLAHGVGKLEAFISGELDGTYVGRMTDGLLHGKGQYTFKNGSKFEGSYVDGFRDGNGKYTHPNGYEFQGNYFKGSPSGLGVQKEPNGTRYEGGFLNGKRSGAGTLYFTNGSGYKGNFEDGKPLGLFKSTSLVDADKDYEFKDGKFVLRSLNADVSVSKIASSAPPGSRTLQARLWNGKSILGTSCTFYYPHYDSFYKSGTNSSSGKRSVFWWSGGCAGGMLNGSGALGFAEIDTAKNTHDINNSHQYSVVIFENGVQVGGLNYKNDSNKFAGLAKSFTFTEFFSVESTRCVREGHFLIATYCAEYQTFNYKKLWKTSFGGDLTTGWDDKAKAYNCETYHTVDQCKWASENKNDVEAKLYEARSAGQCRVVSSLLDRAKLGGGLGIDAENEMRMCKSNEDFYSIVNERDPQKMFLAAGQYESKGERGRAKTIYNSIISRFSKSPVAVHATNRLTALADVEAVESAGSRAAQASRDAAASVRTQNYEQCVATENSCYSRCDSLKDSSSRSSCRNGCYKGCNK